jgi:flagellar hook-associated protein 1 FlgK
MPSLSSGIHIALQAVLAHSQAIEVIEHNVANVNTRGYRRQAASLSATAPSQIYGSEHGPGAGQRGTGVTVDSIQRFSLDFFDGRFREALAGTKNWQMQQEALTQIESTLAETGSDGLTTRLDAFWSGWQLVAADPTNTSLRQALLDETGALTKAFNRRAESLTRLRDDQNAAVSSRVGEINTLGQRVAELNAEISRVLSLGEQPNDLLDQRDLLLDRLAESCGAVSSIQKNGEAVVTIGGHILVTGHDALRLTTRPGNPDSSVSEVVWESGQPFKAPGGELKGILHARDQVIPQQRAALDSLAAHLAGSVNTLHSAGYGLDGSHGQALFTGSNAMDLRLNGLVNARSLAASTVNGEQANSALADAIFNLKTTAVIGGETLNGFYTRTVTGLGLELQRVKASAGHYGAVSSALGQQRESVAGVSLDEEAANLVKAQKAYQAAARVMTAYDELLDRIINGMGLVGR